MQKVCIWTPDKDLAQCVRGDRIVQVDRRNQKIRNAEGVREKFGVDPVLIPDLLALIGDAADGFPGIAGIGAVTAARLLNRHGMIEDFPRRTGRQSRTGPLFKNLATLRTDARLVPRYRRAALAWTYRRIRRVCGASGRSSSPGALSGGTEGT